MAIEATAGNELVNKKEAGFIDAEADQGDDIGVAEGARDHQLPAESLGALPALPLHPLYRHRPPPHSDPPPVHPAQWAPAQLPP